MQNNSLPIWIAWIQALAPTVIAIIALIVTAWIQIGQKTISHNKLKLDLFKERYELLNVVSNMIKAANRKTEDFLADMSKEYEKFRQYSLLFPKDIAAKVDRLSDYCYDYQGRLEEMKGASGSPDALEARKQWRASMEKVEGLAKELREEISEFIRVDWRE